MSLVRKYVIRRASIPEINCTMNMTSQHAIGIRWVAFSGIENLIMQAICIIWLETLYMCAPIGPAVERIKICI